MFADLLAKLMEGSSESETAVRDGIMAFGKFLFEQPVIHCYVDGTPNFGHQATTIHLLKRIIDVYGYTRKVKVVYQVSEKGESTPSKLSKLITGLIPESIETAKIEYGACKDITFLPYEKRDELGDEGFGFTGGADNVGINLATELKVALFLRLQPYVWRSSGGQFVPNRIEFRNDVKAPFDLVEQTKHFPLLAYKFAGAPVPPNVWDWYTSQTFNPSLADNTKRARAVFDVAESRKLTLWPLYGLHQFGESNDIARDLLLTLLIVGLERQRSLNFDGPPMVMAVINDMSKLNPQFLDSFLEGNVAAIKKQLLDDYGDFITPVQTKGINAIAETLSKAVDRLNPVTRAKRLANDASPDTIIQTLGAAKPGSVTVVPIGPVPQEVYNHFYASSGMPGAFEGQGTSSVTISLGKPYLQMPKSGATADNYPNKTLLDKVVEKDPQQANNASAELRRLFASYLNTNDPEAYGRTLATVTNFVNDALAKDTSIAAYFKFLGDYFQQDIHDKLLLGLVAVNSVITGGETFALLAKAPGVALTLDDVYVALTTNWSDGVVNLLAALPDTQLAAFYGSIVGNSLPIAVQKENIIAEKKDGVTVAVLLSNGETDAFGPRFGVELTFTAPYGFVTSDLRCASQEAWTIDGAPWLGFESPGFEMTVTESPAPVRGRAQGKIKGTPLTLGIEYPIQPDRWALDGTIDPPYPSAATFFAMAGGINLVQTLPPPLNTLAGFGLSQVQGVYDSAQVSIASFAFAMETSEEWVILRDPMLSIRPRVDVLITEPGSLQRRKVAFRITGVVTIGTGAISITARYPDYFVGGTQEGDIALADVTALFGVTAPISGAITDLAFAFEPPISAYSFGMRVEASWPITIAGKTIFEITALGFNVAGTTISGYVVGFSGETAILPGTADEVKIAVSAAYQTKTRAWLFEGQQTAGVVSLSRLILHYLGWSNDADYGIAGLGITIDTATSSYTFTGRTAEPWVVPFIPELTVSAKLTMGYLGAAAAGDGCQGQGTFGSLETEWVWQNIKILVFFDYCPTKVSFGIQWNGLRGVVTGPDPVTGDWVVTLGFAGTVTLGSIVETMVSWATGSAFALESPWSVLNSIPLSGLSLVWTFNRTNPSRNKVGFKIDIGPIDLGFCRIDGINVVYNSQAAERVAVTLNGTFPWSSNTGSLGPWDASQPGTAPAPPGQGNQYLDLRLLALGQHVTVQGLTSAPTVQKAIELIASMKDPEPGKVPEVTFDPDSAWFVGADFGVLRFGDGGTKP